MNESRIMKSLIKNNLKKFREFNISFVAGLFSGVPIALVFGQVSPNHQIKENVIIFSVILFAFFLLYYLGLSLTKKYYPEKDIFSYHSNFIAGSISSISVGLLITFKEMIEFILPTIIVIFFFNLMFILRKKR